MGVYPVISLKPSYNSVVRGCPGIPETLPRIECQLQIKSNNGSPFEIDAIEITLKTVETVHNLSTLPTDLPASTTSTSLKGSNSLLSKAKKKRNKFEMVTVHHTKRMVLKNDNKKNNVIGLDIPLTIALPDDIKDTNFNSKFGNCVTLLECIVHYGSNKSKTLNQLINVERYTYLPAGYLFPKIEKVSYSPDKKYKVSYVIENPCVSCDDILRLRIKFQQNTMTSSAQSKNRIFNKKIKLKSVILQLNEYLEFCDSSNSSHAGLEPRENVLQVYTKEINQVISLNEIIIDIDVRIFTKDKWFQNFESTSMEPEFMYKLPDSVTGKSSSDIKTVLLKNKNKNIPFQFHNSITTIGKFFAILHSLSIHFRISNGKDFEVSQNITITKWPKSQLRYIQQLIKQEKETAQYAVKFYSGFGSISKKYDDPMDLNKYHLEYPNLPPVIHYPVPETLNKFNIHYNVNYKNPHRIPVIE